MTDRSTYESDVAAALDAAEPPVVHVETGVSDIVTVAVKNGYTLSHTPNERWQSEPVRPRGTITALTATGFADAVNLRLPAEQDGASVVYADHDKCALVAIVNDDGGGDAGWRDHRIELQLRSTPEWTLWTSRQGLGSQEKFAETIEEGENEIVDPTATSMLELAQTFHASTSAKFRQSGRLTDGRTQFVYEEDVDAKAGESGQLTIPATFTLALRPFHGAQPVLVTARLRYRLARGDLQIGYFLHRVDDIKRAAFAELVEGTRAALALPVVEAVAPPPTTPAS